MSKLFLSTFIAIFLCLSISGIKGQQPGECSEGLFLLRRDTLFELNKRLDGKLQFIPNFVAPFLDSVGALAYWETDGFYYGLRYDNAHLIRFRLDGTYEDLGQAAGDSIPLPNEDLISAIIAEDELFVLAYSTNSIYAIDLHSNPLRYRTVVKNITYGLPNTLAWHPVYRQLYILDQSGTPIGIDPKSGRLDLPYRNAGFSNFPRKQLLSYGKLWFDKKGHCMLLAGQEGTLYELDTDEKVAYAITELGFNSPKDAVYCPSATMPDFLDPELLSLQIHPYKDYPSFLELEWYENNSNSQKTYYHSERLNEKNGQWEEISFIPGFARTKQSNRYNALDRSPAKMGACYRLRIVYTNGAQGYSPIVCYNPDSNYVHPNLIMPESPSQFTDEANVHLQGFAGNDLYAQLIDPISKKVLWERSFHAFSNNFSLPFSVPKKAGYYEWRVFMGLKCFHQKVFVR